MSSILNGIRAALEAHLRSMDPAPLIYTPNRQPDSDRVKIRDENDPVEQELYGIAPHYAPRKDDTFVRAQFVPRTRRPHVRGPDPINEYRGLYSLVACTPLAVGEGPGLQLADRLLDQFPSSSAVTRSGVTVRIDYSEVGLAYPDPVYFNTPITVSWYSYD